MKATARGHKHSLTHTHNSNFFSPSPSRSLDLSTSLSPPTPSPPPHFLSLTPPLPPSLPPSLSHSLSLARALSLSRSAILHPVEGYPESSSTSFLEFLIPDASDCTHICDTKMRTFFVLATSSAREFSSRFGVITCVPITLSLARIFGGGSMGHGE
jgi:hypothetical protein